MNALLCNHRPAARRSFAAPAIGTALSVIR
jgi:hypothetical protein